MFQCGNQKDSLMKVLSLVLHLITVFLILYKNADFDKYKYSDSGIEFDFRGIFS